MQFVKMEGIGNDFILMHGLAAAEYDTVVAKASFLCDRRKGIGADGIIFILPAKTDTADYRMVIINSDGSEAEMCGNGVRCFALYVNEMELTDKKRLTIDTPAGIIRTEQNRDEITVDMGAPVLAAEKIPTLKSGGRVVMEPVVVDDREFLVTAVSMGNPHAVTYADELTDDLVLGYGPRLESHTFFPKKVNTEFIKVISDNEIEMRVYERGCGETMACGTGACAAVVAGILNNKHGNRVVVHLRGGDLTIAWDGDPEHSVFMTGPACIVYKGEVTI